MSYYARGSGGDRPDPLDLPGVMTGEQARNEPIMQGEAHIVLKTESHPEANGRIPEPGDKVWSIRMSLEDGRILEVQTGWNGLAGLIAMCEKIRLEEQLAALNVEPQP